MTTPREAYLGRIHRVMDHIDAHLAEPLDLPALAAVANFSPWHFHRLFLAITGETLGDRVRRRRLEVAALRLLMTPPATALAIGLDVGFQSAEVFTRAFKAHFGVTPSRWRGGGWRDWFERHRHALRKIHQGERNPRQALAAVFSDDEFAGSADPANRSKGAEMNVSIETLPAARVAYLRNHGPYGDPAIAKLWQRFAAWCASNRLADHAVYGVTHDSPDITSPNQCRYDTCVEVDTGFRPSGEIGVQALPGGLYACTEFAGTPDRIHAAWMALCGDWLPDSGWQADDRPCVEAYGSDLKIDPKTGAFRCRLCLPVRNA